MRDIIVEVYDREGNLLRRVKVESEHTLKVTAEGQEETKVEDMFSIWFFRLLVGMLTPIVRGGIASFSYTDIGGTARTQNVKRDIGAADSDAIFFNVFICPNRLWVVAGTGTTSPTRTDFKLESKIGENVTTIHVDEATLTITLHGSIYFPSAVTVNEIGLEWEGTVAGYGTCGRFLVDRTVLATGVSVPAGGTLAVMYKFRVP